MANDDDLKKMVAAFEAIHAKEGQALRQMLDNTPDLKVRVEQAIEQKQLSGFGPHPDNRAGAYRPGTGEILLPMDVLRTANMDTPRDDSANTARIILGHEIGHAINKAAIDQSHAAFKDKIDEVAKSPSPHDYTTALKAHGAEARTRESKDEIAGVNTLADYVKHSHPEATLKDLYNASTEMANYIDKNGEGAKATYKAKDGLSFGNDLKIDANAPKNVEAMGKLFYDTRGYPQHYGAPDLLMVAEAEEAAQLRDPRRVQPEVRADLKALGIDQDKVPPEWIPNGFRDTGLTPPAPRTGAPAAEPTGADRALHDKVRSGVAQAEQALGKGWDDNSERMTASLTLLAKQSGFSEHDQLSVGFNRPTATRQGGELAFVYRDGNTASSDPYANRAQMPTSEAIARPAQETYQQLQQQHVQQAQTQRVVQEQDTQAQTQATSPPVLTR